MKLGGNWWLLEIGLLLVAAPAWGETPPVSPAQVWEGEGENNRVPSLPPQPPLLRGEDKDKLLFLGLGGQVPEYSAPTGGETLSVSPPQPSQAWGGEGEKSVVPPRIGGQAHESHRPNPQPTPEAIAVQLTPSEKDNTTEKTQLSQTQTTPPPQETPKPAAEQLDLNPEIIENSPVLQRWLEKVPDVLQEIRNDPSFRTRLRLGYSQFPSTDQAAGFIVGVEDAFIGRTGLTISGDYQASFNGDREAVGADLRYYVLPLGSYINIAPQVGYRYVETGNFSTDGVNVGLRLMLALSRTGAADISVTQSFVSPGSSEEVGITTLSVGYAVTRNLRVSTDIQKQNSREEKDSRVGIVLEWMP